MILSLQGCGFAYEMENVVRLFFPGEKLRVEKDSALPDDTDGIAVRAEVDGDGRWSLSVRVRLNGFDQAAEEKNLPAAREAEWAAGRLLFRLLAEATGDRPPWGALTGVRPVTLCRAMAAEGRDDAAVEAFLRDIFLATPGKAALALDVLRQERPLLQQIDPEAFSLYISIPFCPSRCLYCSFVSHDIKGVARLVPDYVRLLCEEIRYTGELARRQGLRLQTVYMGGGTPTTLAAEQLEQILETVAESFDLSGLLEYTVEAGRPDTITAEKLAVLRRWGVARVSINPQTMNDELLRAIGRDHTAAQIREGYALAREAGFPCVNMDLIAGLPGETAAGFAATLADVLAMSPENVTVHTLTVKRSSRLREREGAFAGSRLDVSALLDDGRSALGAAGYRPYYLYRQKGTVQNLENVGYARPGFEGLYNVLIMEEIQTVLAVGAGAVTKLYRPGQSLRRVFNYKFPYEYIDRFDEILRRKDEAAAILAGWRDGPRG